MLFWDWSRNEDEDVYSPTWYADDGETVDGQYGVERPCPRCHETADDYDSPDPCLGQIPGVVGACCGHGNIEQAHVVFDDHSVLHGIAAIRFFEEANSGQG
jgi:hypothetical protein